MSVFSSEDALIFPVPFNPTYGLGVMKVKTSQTDTTLSYGEIGSPGCQLGKSKNC